MKKIQDYGSQNPDTTVTNPLLHCGVGVFDQFSAMSLYVSLFVTSFSIKEFAPVLEGTGIDRTLPGYSKAVPNLTLVVMFPMIAFCDEILDNL
jgi:hypothetical protein